LENLPIMAGTQHNQHHAADRSDRVGVLGNGNASALDSAEQVPWMGPSRRTHSSARRASSPMPVGHPAIKDIHSGTGEKLPSGNHMMKEWRSQCALPAAWTAHLVGRKTVPPLRAAFFCTFMLLALKRRQIR